MEIRFRINLSYLFKKVKKKSKEKSGLKFLTFVFMYYVLNKLQMFIYRNTFCNISTTNLRERLLIVLVLVSPILFLSAY